MFGDTTHPGVSIEYVDIVSGVQIVNRTFTIDFEGICIRRKSCESQDEMRRTFIHLNVDGPPPDIVFASLFVDNALILRTSPSLFTRKVDQSSGRRDDGPFVPDSIFVKQCRRCVVLDLNSVHIEASLGEIFEVTTDY